MVKLRVDFQPYTSLEWAKEEIDRLGIYLSDSIFVSNLNSFHALVKVRDEDYLRISSDLQTISRVVKVFRV